MPLFRLSRVLCLALPRFSDLEAYVVSYRDTRDKGGKVFYNLLLLGLGVTLPYVEAGLSMELGELVVVRVRKRFSSINSSRLHLVLVSYFVSVPGR